MALSIAGVFWRALRPSDLAYGHTRISQGPFALGTEASRRLVRASGRAGGAREKIEKTRTQVVTFYPHVAVERVAACTCTAPGRALGGGRGAH